MTSPTNETLEMLHFQRSLLSLAATVDALESEAPPSPVEATPPITEPSVNHCSILDAWARRLQQPRSLAS